MIKLVRKLSKDNSGASAAEYALIVAVMGGLVVAGTQLFGQSLSTALDTTGTSLTNNATANQITSTP